MPIHLSTVAIPPEVGALTSLTAFSIFDNMIRITPPKSITKLSHLELLQIQKNEFEGDISYLCPSAATDFKSDCGKQGGVKCSCCSSCGFAKGDKNKMNLVEGGSEEEESLE